jgi:hypothetical protein
MGKIKRWLLAKIQAFIIRTIVEDYRNNGKIRGLIASEGLETAAIYGEPGPGVPLRSSIRSAVIQNP